MSNGRIKALYRVVEALLKPNERFVLLVNDGETTEVLRSVDPDGVPDLLEAEARCIRLANGDPERN